jgi:hypothetical protein
MNHNAWLERCVARDLNFLTLTSTVGAQRGLHLSDECLIRSTSSRCGRTQTVRGEGKTAPEVREQLRPVSDTELHEVLRHNPAQIRTSALMRPALTRMSGGKVCLAHTVQSLGHAFPAGFAREVNRFTLASGSAD